MARVKAREVFEKLQGKFPPEAVEILASLAERQEVQHLQIKELAILVNKLMDQWQMFLNNAGVERDKLNKLLKGRGLAVDATVQVDSYAEQDDDAGPTR